MSRVAVQRLPEALMLPAIGVDQLHRLHAIGRQSGNLPVVVLLLLRDGRHGRGIAVESILPVSDGH